MRRVKSQAVGVIMEMNVGIDEKERKTE